MRARARLEPGAELRDLGGWTVVIVGMGSIGALVAERLARFGAP